MNFEESIYFLLYIFFYIILLIKFKRSRYKSKIGITLIFIWLFSSLAGFYYDLDPIFFHYNKITLIPFIYFFIVNLIIFLPVLKNNPDKILVIHYNKRITRYLTIFIIIISIPCFFENVIHLLVNGFSSLSADSINARYEDVDETYSYLSKVSEMFTKIYHSLCLIVPLLFFLSIKEKNKLNMIGLIICIVNSVIESFCIGSRVMLVFLAFSFLITYLLIGKFLDERFKKRLVRKTFYPSLIVLTIFVAITVVRYNSLAFSSRVSITQWVCQYAGECHGNFNADCWHITYFSKDDIVSKIYKKDFLGQNFKQREFTGKTPYPDEFKIIQFYGAIGTYFSAYGHVITFILFAFASILFCHLLKIKRKYKFSSIVLYLFYAKIPFLGFTYFTYQYDAQQVVVIPIIYFILKFYERKSSVIKVPTNAG